MSLVSYAQPPSATALLVTSESIAIISRQARIVSIEEVEALLATLEPASPQARLGAVFLAFQQALGELGQPAMSQGG